VLTNARVAVLGIAAWSGTGKTTLLVQVLPRLRAQGLRVGLIKYSHHAFELDTPGKDSYELRKAGASPVLLASPARWALMAETPALAEPALDDLLGRMDQSGLDLILVEGYRHEAFPKLELYRSSLGKPPLYPSDAQVLAVATDGPLPAPPGVPVLDLNRPEEVAAFILDYVAGRPGG